MSAAKGDISGAGDHNHSRIGVVVRAEERIEQRLFHRAIHCVAFTLVLDRHNSDMSPRLDQDVTHLLPPDEFR
jgi:hypothetical protein